MTREEATKYAERKTEKDKQVLLRVGLPMIVTEYREEIYYDHPNPDDGSERIMINADPVWKRRERVMIRSYRSELNGFTFEKSHSYYWCVHGKLPMDAAMPLYYRSAVGKTDIRVAGHCGCPAPDEAPWFSWITPDGKTVCSLNDDAEAREFAEKHPTMRDTLEKFVASDEPEKIAKRFVTSYHIDSELGLYVFVQAIKDLKNERANSEGNKRVSEGS